MFRSRRGYQLLRPLSNNTNTPCQCSYSLIYAHTVTTALSDCLSEPPHMAVIYSQVSGFSSVKQGVDTNPCLVNMYRLFPDTGQEVSAPTVSTHNRHQLSHQLSVVIASTSCPTSIRTMLWLPITVHVMSHQHSYHAVLPEN